MEAVFYGVLGASFEDFHELTPFLLACILDDMGEEKKVFFLCPRALLDGGIEEAGIVFPALLGVPINFL